MDDTAATPISAPRERPATAFSGQRLESIDILRGIVIAVMALDHVRDFFHQSAFLFNPLDVDKTSILLYLTRWITHFCAPTFVFLAGASAFLYGVKVDNRASLSRFLLTRGLWLILLELSVVSYAWNFSQSGAALQVIWAIGAAMVVLSALVWLPRSTVLAIGIIIVAGHNLLDGFGANAATDISPIWRLLHAGGPIVTHSGYVLFVVYPVLPWIGVMALGYGLGSLFLREPGERQREFKKLGLSMLGMFFVFRGLHVYGDPHDWDRHANFLATVGDFFDVRKYPPSLLYILATLGTVFALMPRIEQLRGRVAEIFLTFGRVPMFFYVLHLYLAHGLMMLIGMAMGHPASMFVGVMANPKALVTNNWGFSLPVVYIVWLLVLAILYPACRWFGEVKRRRRDWWLSYL